MYTFLGIGVVCVGEGEFSSFSIAVLQFNFIMLGFMAVLYLLFGITRYHRGRIPIATLFVSPLDSEFASI